MDHCLYVHSIIFIDKLTFGYIYYMQERFISNNRSIQIYINVRVQFKFLLSDYFYVYYPINDK